MKKIIIAIACCALVFNVAEAKKKKSSMIRKIYQKRSLENENSVYPQRRDRLL